MDDLKYQREVSSVKFHPVIKEICFVCFDACSLTSQSPFFFSHVAQCHNTLTPQAESLELTTIRSPSNAQPSE